MMRGVVKWFSDQRGFGFIETQDGDVFVRWNDVVGDHEPYSKNLDQGFEVEFDLVQGERGMRAENVRVLRKGATTGRSVWQAIGSVETRVKKLEDRVFGPEV